MAERCVHRGVSTPLRSDKGPDVTANAVHQWLQRVGVQTLFMEPGSPWENGYVESGNGKLRDELLNRERCATLWEVQVLVERGRRHDNQLRPPRALGYGHPLLKRSRPSRVRTCHSTWYNHRGPVSNVRPLPSSILHTEHY